MDFPQPVSRRRFIGGAAATAGILSLTPSEIALWAQGAAAPQGGQGGRRAPMSDAEWDAMARLNNNENCYGPPETVLQAMTKAMKYANRYGYPDGDITQEIANHHGVKPENVLLGSGSGELLDVVGTTFLTSPDKKVVGSDPSYGSVYQQATTVKADAIKVPLLPDYRQDIAGLIKATKTHYRDVGFVYLCNPNNPTGQIVTKKEMKHLLNELPEDMPVLIDEAYHHFVDDDDYATSVPYVTEGRPVIICRTFSKIAALAGMRLGYSITTPEIARKMRVHQTGTINAIVKWGGVAALKDTASQAQVKKVTLDLRKKAVRDLKSLGYDSIPSEANFFMVAIKRPVQPVIEEFRKRNVLVGRPFPPMLEHLRVSVGTADEMARFATAFREIFAPGAAVGGKSGA
jgi:histidinol-phosphate aminotransferase